MFKIILIIGTLVILLIQSVFSLNSADLCSSLVCEGKYNYKCGSNLCSLNEAKCDDYLKFIQSLSYRSFHVLKMIKTRIAECESNKLDWNDYCAKNSNCFKKQLILTKTGFKTMDTKVECKCGENYKHSYKCGDYCTLDSQYCEILNLRMQYQKKLNKTEIQNCA